LNVLGTHVLLELRECDPQLLDDLVYIREQLLNAAATVDAHVIGESFHQFSPQGVTGILSIAESHISIHTWPEHGYAAADIFTCGDQTKPDRAAAYIIAALRCQDPEITQIRRGLDGANVVDLHSAPLIR
jgi:S-adenosylmethionine decarboxylase